MSSEFKNRLDDRDWGKEKLMIDYDTFRLMMRFELMLARLI